MLVIRMQRTGRKGHAMFRVVVQDSRRTPTSGKIVASLGSYDPHSKTLQLNKERAQFYLDHGAQPSERVARLLKQEGIKLPDWVKLSEPGQRAVRNPDKRRSTAPAQPEEAAPADSDNTESATPEAPEETVSAVEEESDKSEATEEKPVEESEAAEASAEKSDEADKSA